MAGFLQMHRYIATSGIFLWSFFDSQVKFKLGPFTKANKKINMDDIGKEPFGNRSCTVVKVDG